MKLLLLPLLLSLVSPARAASDADRGLARDIMKELVELDTTDSTGQTTPAAEAVRRRLLAAGFSADDALVVGPEKRGNLVARLRGTGAKKPVLWICHLDVVEAKREDWSTDPFRLVVKDGFFQARGTEDVKGPCSLLAATMIRLKRDGYKPERDIILALTAGEETGNSNGVDWLLKNKRELVDAELVLNPDAGSFEVQKGKRTLIGLQASEKLYADFSLEVHTEGGHSARPTFDANALYVLNAGLSKLAAFKFPFELNEVTRGYFAGQTAFAANAQEAADMKAILREPPDEQAVVRLSSSPFYDSRYRTTCVATRLEAGQANNALPGSAKAVVNCRILPGHPASEIRETLVKLFADPRIQVKAMDDYGNGTNPASPLTPEVMKPLQAVAKKLYPGVPIVPFMDAGASDGAITRAAGMPTYGVAGVFLDVDDNRSHGKDERLPVESFYEGLDFFYAFTKAVAGGK